MLWGRWGSSGGERDSNPVAPGAKRSLSEGSSPRNAPGSPLLGPQFGPRGRGLRATCGAEIRLRHVQPNIGDTGGRQAAIRSTHR